jgi:2-polyprenyl-6-methoxyphenol hydroxylase-like FAD-dependent oxidoreductase
VLSDYFENVTVCERDRYPDYAQHRPGVPQSPHLHGLLARGLEIVEELFPGIRSALIASGAIELNAGTDFAWLMRAGWGVRYPNGSKLLSFTRPLIDWHIRERVRRIPNVKILDTCDVLGLIPGPGCSISGVRARFRAAATRAAIELHADLVVDASGRRSRAPEWLADFGAGAVEETVVDASIGYASRVYKRPKGFESDWKAILLQIAPPQHTRGALMFPIEGDKWLVTLNGGGGDYPPSDPDGFVEFARSLRDPIVYDAIKGAQPLTNPVGFRNTENRLRHYERLQNMPDRFVVTGDGVCAFNPIYGQGMTVAMLGTLALRECLEAGARRRTWTNGLDGFSKLAQSELAKVNGVSWMLATGEDYRYPNVDGPPAPLATKVMHKYVDRIAVLNTRDPKVRRLWSDVLMMIEPPTALFRPSVLAKVLFASRQRREPPRRPRLVLSSQDPVQSA